MYLWYTILFFDKALCPYVLIVVSLLIFAVGTKTFKTRVIKDNINPVWNQFYEVCTINGI